MLVREGLDLLVLVTAAVVPGFVILSSSRALDIKLGVSGYVTIISDEPLL
jgi:hypothetical protein